MEFELDLVNWGHWRLDSKNGLHPVLNSPITKWFEEMGITYKLSPAPGVTCYDYWGTVVLKIPDKGHAALFKLRWWSNAQS